MKRYLLTAGAVVFFMTVLFLAVEALGVPLLTDPAPWMKGGGALAASSAWGCSSRTCCCPCRRVW